LVGKEEWDEILVVEYPSRKAFLNMVQSDEYKVPKQIRNEALEDSRLISMQAPKRQRNNTDDDSEDCLQ
jgi:uncharacterized protein (DUF1330 family)